MNTDNFKHYSVFTNPPRSLHKQKNNVNALGNNASVAFAESLPTETQCLKHSKDLDTTCVFIAPNKQGADSNQHFDIVWYYRQQRIQRCGHGTLAAACYLHETMQCNRPLIFHSAIEQISVNREKNKYCLQLSQTQLISSNTGGFSQANRAAKSHNHDGYYLIDVGSESAVKRFEFKNAFIDSIEQRALIVTGLSDNPQYDVVFRYFAPQYGVLEDQATGSAGPCLWAFWQNHFAAKALRCYQASTRGGFFMLSKPSDKVIVSGYITEK